MHGKQLFRLVLEHMRRPQRSLNARALVLKLSSQPAIDDLDAVQNGALAANLFRHEEMVTPG
jgi:hypothetical protein